MLPPGICKLVPTFQLAKHYAEMLKQGEREKGAVEARKILAKRSSFPMIASVSLADEKDVSSLERKTKNCVFVYPGFPST